MYNSTLRVLLKKLHQNKRQTLTTISMLIILNLVVFVGVFSYFHGEDASTNRFSAQQFQKNDDEEQPFDEEPPLITLEEPQWVTKGEEMAKISEPGMQIPKDPYAWNTGTTNEYCRIKMTVSLNNSTTEEKNKAALIGIINAICLSNDENDKLINFDNDTWNCLNPSFQLDSASIQYGASNQSVSCYFYYIAQKDTMKLLQPTEKTEYLFRYVNIPIYKQDYYDIFDREYSIELQAEGVAASIFSSAPTIAQFKAKADS